MYEFFSQISNFLSQPFLTLRYTTESIPILSAFILGIIGALAPCQFTGNLGAITIYGNKSVQKSMAWSEVVLFILGKIVVFSGLGLVVWLLGSEFESTLTLYFPWIRRVVGPILIFIGLFMIGLIKFRKSLSLGSIPDRFLKKGKLGSFLMGVSFSLGFCPTMFVLFFVSLMPMVVSVSYGAVLPTIFAIGTSLPLIIAIFLIWYFELSGKLMKKKGRKLGSVVQKLAGWIMIILGILDTLTYWT
ncbi:MULTISPECIES: urease accessory protein UreH domain-containing protein [Metabacillus]|uniref:urease accessory protein UreH domain-containing protein n=1 Tax=Metabacillus TaxID=2675233 RepID=UPI001B9A68AB|nr:MULTISPECIES: sulfite exporter TauE/SafE family protein [Metabacillus]MCM3164081.1 sulfite exporter TauE/SafE family protein [Metabacillus litoralis]UGB33518.1 sulfite exporter TauE/SafE family protein [Metabacillus sp. B2-18]